MTTAPAATRCAVHPGRTSFDTCPVCARPRCLDDARRLEATGCEACQSAVFVRRAGHLELIARAVAASLPAAYVGGWIATQYVDTQTFSLVVPALVGLAATWLAGLASYRAGASTSVVVVIGAIVGLLGTGLGFRLYPNGPHDPLRPWSLVGAPYLCTIGGAVLWLFILRPTRRIPYE